MNKAMNSLLILLIFSSISEASNWQFIRPTGADKNGFYIDMDNVKRVSKSKVIDTCNSNVLIEAKRKMALFEEGAKQGLFLLKRFNMSACNRCQRINLESC